VLTLYFIGLLTYRDPDLVKRIGSATALEVRATGIPYVFAPCIAVNNLLHYQFLNLFVDIKYVNQAARFMHFSY